MIVALQTLVYFRQSLLSVLEKLLLPYYEKLASSFGRLGSAGDEEEEEQVFAEFDDEKGVVFFPPVYLQRYAAVSDCLMDERWCGQLEKVVDLGHHDMSFIKYLKEVPGVRCIIGVDIESIPLRCSSDLLGCEDYAPKRESPLKVTLFQGNAADPDYRLIGTDAVVAIEMIEHMLPHDLERMVHTVFGFVKPRVAVFTTPNGDFNVLFKSMEKNGLRRWDHFFEWTREQFHDWCSNIVTRYPQYTVTCKGVGPGPPGTLHYGCCSQLALFVNKDYQKQHELNPDSLALVANAPSANMMRDIVAGWESPTVDDNTVVCCSSGSSLSDGMFSTRESCMRMLIASSTFTLETLEYADKTAQCNLDTEIGRNFLMFNDEDACISILVPRRNTYNRVYEIEDVNCRLNCSTYQVKKFSQTAQKLMAKYKLDSLMHTREVVSEIRHLTNMLNFNNDSDIHGQNGKHIWHNFNWGENAPYWNQYYKIVREFNYPFETKSEESRIIDLITDEINKLTDAAYPDDCSKVEIPIRHLMKVVSHITDDVDRVKDLLEWNGYEVVDDMVIHSRLVVGNASVTTDAEEWPENETDWDTSDVMSFSDASTIVPDCNGRALRHALDAKVRKLRAMVSADEDITTELDKVVCRLMKLALRSSKSRTTAPPPRWMQYKLLDLLTLTEKTIAKRKQFCIQGSPLKAIGFGQVECIEPTSLSKFRNDTAAAEILNKYKNIMSFSDIDISTAPFLDNAKDKRDIEKKVIINDEIKLERTQAWVEEKNQVHVVNFPFPNESIESSLTKQRLVENELRRSSKKKRKIGEKKISETKLKKVLPTRSSSSSFVGRYKRYLAFHERRRCPMKSQKRIKDHKILQSTASKPIPGSIIDLCHPELRTHKNIDYTFKDTVCNNVEIYKTFTNTANMEESLLVDIVMDDTEESVALRHNIGTDDEKSLYRAQEAILNSVIKAGKDDQSDKIQPETENFESQTIFIYDINEPSTSKGVRHVSMECGTDPIQPSHAMPSPVSSLTKMPEIFTTGIKIEDSKTNFMKMDGTDSPPILLKRAKSPSIFSKGIKIGDSTTNLSMKNHSSNFGTLVSEEEFPELFHANGRGIKIEDSITNMRKKRSLDFDGSKNSEKCLPIKSEGIECSVFCDVKISNSDEQGSVVHMGSKSGLIITNPFNSEERKVRIHNPKSLKFFQEVKKGDPTTEKKIKKDDSTTEMKTKESNTQKMNFDFFTSSDDNYITDINREMQKINAKKFCTFSTSTDDLDIKLQSTPRLMQPDRVKNKDSNTNVHTKVDCGTEMITDLISNSTPSSTPLKCNAVEMKLIKEIVSATKLEDSCSELNESNVSGMFPPVYANFEGRGEECPSPTAHLKLSRGGIHVHSYKEKQVSEDVMYQGEWQRHKPKINTRRAASKKVIDSALRKRRTISKEIIENKNVEIKKVVDAVPKKKRMSSKERTSSKPDKKFDNKADKKKPVQVRRPKYEKPKEVNFTKTQSQQVKTQTKKNLLKRDSTQKSVRPIRGVVKVASKIAVSSISSKTKNTLVVKRASAMVSTVVSKDDDKKEKRLKNYIPRYLLRRKMRESQQNVNDTIQINKIQANVELGEIQKELTEFNHEPVRIVSYVVFRNEVGGVNNTSTENQTANSVREISSKSREINNGKRNRSPGSPDSSTCSTSDSIATVKAASSSKVSTKKHSTPSRSAVTSESDDNAPVKNKKTANKLVTKKGQIDFDNKENIPESSDKFSKCSLKNHKSAFMGRSKSVFMAQVATDSATKHKDQGYRKSNIKIPAIEDKSEKKICDIPTIMKSTSRLECQDNRNQELIADVSNLAQISAISDQSFDLCSIPQLEYSEDSTVVQEISNYTSKTEWFNSTQNSVASTESSIQASMRRIVEDSLEFAFQSSAIIEELNSENKNLVREHCQQNLEATLSPISYKTTLLGNLNSTVSSELENAINRSFDLETAVDSSSVDSFAASLMTMTDDNIDDFSLYSTSEYFLGDDSIISNNNTRTTNDVAQYAGESVNHFTNQVDSVVDKVVSVVTKVDSIFGKENSNSVDTAVDKDIESAVKLEPNTTIAEPNTSIVGVIGAKEQSVHGIYERKETLVTENPGGSLAVQAFSGFSMNTDRVVGDQPDYVNLIDSETGSLAVEYTRQTTSEEVFVSGRSSESFQSCLMDEEAVVPNWLFNIIQQQQSVNIPVQEEDEELLLPMVVPMPMSEPIYDINGNAAEPVGLEAGAGDGRGIHSDNSQDSSGRGTSLSSSETSSGAQSEAILIDPSAFTAQFELIQESVASSAAVTTLVLPGSAESSNHLRRNEETPNEAGPASAARTDARRRDARRYHTSDVDADVSSIDTDIPDSSDN